MTTFERITHPVGVQSVQRFRCRQLALTRAAVLLGGIMPERRLMPLAEPLDWLGHQLVAHDEGELIGVVRLNLGREGGLDYYADLLGAIGWDRKRQATTAVLSRLDVAPGPKHDAVAVRLICEARAQARMGGVTVVLADAAPDHVACFAAAGFVPLPGRAGVHPCGGPLQWLAADPTADATGGAFRLSEQRADSGRRPGAPRRSRGPRGGKSRPVESTLAVSQRHQQTEFGWLSGLD